MFYPNIEAERKRHGMTKKQFAAAIGIIPRTYHAYQTRGKIRASKVKAMADLFGCSTDYLLGRTTERNGLSKGGGKRAY